MLDSDSPSSVACRMMVCLVVELDRTNSVCRPNLCLDVTGLNADTRLINSRHQFVILEVERR